MNIAGRIAKYLATSLAIENVVSAAARHQQLLADLDHLEQLGRVASRGRPCCRLPCAACVPVFIATPTSAWASAGASLVPSPVIATSLPFACSSRMSAQLRLGRGLGQEVVDAGLGGDRRRGERVVAGDHHRADAHRAEAREALLDAALDHVLEVDDAEHARAVRRRPAACRPASAMPWRDLRPARRARARRAPRRARAIGVDRALADARGRRGRSRSCASAR